MMLVLALSWIDDQLQLHLIYQNLRQVKATL
jgi:hypothetical protein